MKSPSLFSASVPTEDGQKHFRLRGLDGLRAIAVVAVVVYHLWPSALPGGLIGVDLFFVISGYLITALLLREAAYTGKMHLPQFWMRRLRRLVPAMVLCVIVCTSLALAIGGDALVSMPRQVLSALTYTSNWASLLGDNDYFAQNSPEIFTNFWSLALEEQFYLAWPVILVTTCMLVFSWKKRTLVPVVLGLGSILAMAVRNHFEADMMRGYYGLDTHAFGLMIGAVLALLIPWSMYPPREGSRVLDDRYSPGLNAVRVLVGWASLGLLPFVARALTEHEPAVLAPWGLVVASLLGVGVIQALLPDVRGTGAEWLRGLLSLRPLKWIGKRSYGMYLWHWPLMALVHYGAQPVAENVQNVVVLVLTTLIAAASYRWLEEPVRKQGFLRAIASLFHTLRRPSRVRWAAIASMALAILAVAGTVTACFQAPSTTAAKSVLDQGRDALDSSSAPPPATPSPTGPAPYRSTPGGQDVTMIGDSVTLSAADALQNRLPGINVDASVGRKFSEGLDLAQKRLDQGTLGRIVVVSLPTNAGITQEDIDALTKISESGQVRQMVLVTGQAPQKLDWVARSNDAIRTAGADQDRITVADWAQATDGKPDLLVSDGIHPEADGQDLYATTVADAVGRAKQELVRATSESTEDSPAASSRPTG